MWSVEAVKKRHQGSTIYIIEYLDQIHKEMTDLLVKLVMAICV